LTSNDALIKKQLYAKYGRENFRQLGVIYKRDADWSTWSNLRGEKDFIKKNYPVIFNRYEQHPQQCLKEIADWDQFKKRIPAKDITSFFPDDYDAYRNFLKQKYSDKSDSSDSSDKNAITKLNQNWQRAFNNFAEILPLKSFLLQQKWFAPERADFEDLIAYNQQLPAEQIKIIPTRMLWTLYLEKRFVNISKFTKTSGVKTKQFSDLSMPTEKDRKLYPIWQDFLKKKYPLRLIKLTGNYKNATAPHDPIKRMQWLDFVLKKVPTNNWRLNRPVDLYREFLQDKYKNIATVNNAYSTNYKNFKQITLPLKLADYVEFAEHKNSIRWTFFTANYKKVIDYLTTKGRAIWVTVLLVALTVLGALPLFCSNSVYSFFNSQYTKMIACGAIPFYRFFQDSLFDWRKV
ncbi:MAG: beta-galactosidase, partial [Victivallaceae bacterium]|nr:beta-galactosidase [Victivallaceae bacterium]